MARVFAMGYRHPRESDAKAGVQGGRLSRGALDSRFRASGGTRTGRTVPDASVPSDIKRMVEIIRLAGLVIEQFGEPCANPELTEAQPVVADTRVAPLFLHIRARNPRVLPGIRVDGVDR
jgi:hypothetical protein